MIYIINIRVNIYGSDEYVQMHTLSYNIKNDLTCIHEKDNGLTCHTLTYVTQKSKTTTKRSKIPTSSKSEKDA